MSSLIRGIRSVWDGILFFDIKLNSCPRLYGALSIAVLVGAVFAYFYTPPLAGILIAVPPVILVLSQLRLRLSPKWGPQYSTSPNYAVLDRINNSKPCKVDKKRGYRSKVPEPISGAVGSVHLSKKFNVQCMANPNWDVKIEILVGEDSPYEKIISGIRKQHKAFYQIGKRRIREKLFDGLQFINERKIGIASDFEVNMPKLKVYETSYFATWCSGDLAVKNIIEKKKSGPSNYSESIHRIPFTEGTNTKGTKRLMLKPLSESSRDISAQFGINFIGVTSDNVLRVAIQGQLNEVGPGQRVPLASGSMDWRDLTDLPVRKRTLRNLGEHAANRELREEWGGSGKKVNGEPLTITSFLPVGIFRVPARSGKPEFAAIGKLNWTDTDLIPDKREMEDWDRKTKGLRYNVPDLVGFKYAIKKLKSNHWQHKDTIPLFGVLVCIEDLLKGRPDLIRQTLGYQVPGSGLTMTSRKTGHPPRTAAP